MVTRRRRAQADLNLREPAKDTFRALNVPNEGVPKENEATHRQNAQNLVRSLGKFNNALLGFGHDISVAGKKMEARQEELHRQAMLDAKTDLQNDIILGKQTKAETVRRSKEFARNILPAIEGEDEVWFKGLKDRNFEEEVAPPNTPGSGPQHFVPGDGTFVETEIRDGQEVQVRKKRMTLEDIDRKYDWMLQEGLKKYQDQPENLLQFNTTVEKLREHNKARFIDYRREEQKKLAFENGAESVPIIVGHMAAQGDSKALSVSSYREYEKYVSKHTDIVGKKDREKLGEYYLDGLSMMLKSGKPGSAETVLAIITSEPNKQLGPWLDHPTHGKKAKKIFEAADKATLNARKATRLDFFGSYAAENWKNVNKRRDISFGDEYIESEYSDKARTITADEKRQRFAAAIANDLLYDGEVPKFKSDEERIQLLARGAGDLPAKVKLTELETAFDAFLLNPENMKLNDPGARMAYLAFRQLRDSGKFAVNKYFKTRGDSRTKRNTLDLIADMEDSGVPLDTAFELAGVVLSERGNIPNADSKTRLRVTDDDAKKYINDLEVEGLDAGEQRRLKRALRAIQIARGADVGDLTTQTEKLVDRIKGETATYNGSTFKVADDYPDPERFEQDVHAFVDQAAVDLGFDKKTIKLERDGAGYNVLEKDYPHAPVTDSRGGHVYLSDEDIQNNASRLDRIAQRKRDKKAAARLKDRREREEAVDNVIAP